MDNRSQLEIEAESRLSAFEEVSLEGLQTATLPPIDYAVQNLVPCGYVTLLGGHGGLGKSMLALIIAAHCAAGKSLCDLYTAKVRTTFVSLEDSGDLVRIRLRNIAQAFHIRDTDIAGGITVLDGTMTNSVLMAEVERELIGTYALQELEERAEGSRLIVIDNASDAFEGSENDRRQVRKFMRRLATLAREHNAAVMLLAHVDKAAARNGANGNSYSGSTAWHNSARSRMALVESADGNPLLIHEKNNLGRLNDPIGFQFNERGVLIPVTRASIQAAKASDITIVREVLKDALERGMTITAATSGPSTSYHALEALLPDDVRGKSGKKRVHEVLLDMEKAGEILRQCNVDRYRNKRQVWAFVA